MREIKDTFPEVHLYHPILARKEDREILSSEEALILSKRNYSTLESLGLGHEHCRELFMKRFVPRESGNFELVDYHSLPLVYSSLSKALHFMKKVSLADYKLFKHLISDIWFLKRNGEINFIGGASSNINYIGLITMSLRKEQNCNEFELSTSLVHEMAHNCLYLIQKGDPLIAEECLEVEVFSGVLNRSRPALKALHAAVALAYMINYFSNVVSSVDDRVLEVVPQNLKRRKENLKKKLDRTLRSLSGIHFTQVGKILFDELELILTK